MRWAYFFAIGLTAPGCAAAKPDAPNVVSVIQVNQRAEQLDGQLVRVQGYLTIGPEVRTLYESKALLDQREKAFAQSGFDPRDWQGECITVINALDRKLNLFDYNFHTIEALARVDKDYGKEYIDLGGCYIATGIEVVKVLRIID
jgi:hypothetical protein